MAAALVAGRGILSAVGRWLVLWGLLVAAGAPGVVAKGVLLRHCRMQACC
jgi:hypothetical protein